MYPLVYEYPLWGLLKEGNDSIRIEHVNVTNRSAGKLENHPHGDFVPCAIIHIGRNDVVVATSKQESNHHKPRMRDYSRRATE